MLSLERKIRISVNICGSGLTTAAMGGDISLFSRAAAETFWASGAGLAAIGGICLWRTWRNAFGEDGPDDPEHEDLSDTPQIVELGEHFAYLQPPSDDDLQHAA